MEMNMFCHFGPNTFTGLEWGEGTEPEDMFNPSALDCSQWVSVASAAGFKGIIITAKHHDGFCLWPSPETSHSVAASSWKNGNGDVLRELSDACRAGGLKFGVYISPWDRNDPHYGSPEYNEVFCRTLESALSSYGPVFEQWLDGACGEGPNGKRQVYDWELFHNEVYKHQPEALIFSDAGPGCRWGGNEKGRASSTSWSTFSPEKHEMSPGVLPGNYEQYLGEGDVDGEFWIPSETDVSIRPGWFWRESENGSIKSVRELLRIYYESVGRNSLLLLNVPPDTRGLIHPADSARLMEFRAALDTIFSHDFCAGATASSDSRLSPKCDAANLLNDDYNSFWAARRREASVTVTLDAPATFNRIMLQEYIPLGQRVSSFDLDVFGPDGWETVASETTIGYKRILLIPDVTASKIRVRITGSLAPPVLNRVAAYYDPVMRADEAK